MACLRDSWRTSLPASRPHRNPSRVLRPESVSQGRSEGADLNAVSHAFGGVAETGTLVMISGPESPSTLNFLPDNHIVVLSAKDIAGDYETVFARVRDTYGKGEMPRTVNFITGPSRSADIEQ